MQWGDELRSACEFYGNDLDRQQLGTHDQLQLLVSLINDAQKSNEKELTELTIHSIVKN